MCEYCHEEVNTLNEGWFYTSAKNSSIAQGTASSGLMQKRRVCNTCLQKLREAGLTKEKDASN